MNLKQEIAGWDGKSADDIGAIYSRYCSDEALVLNLIACCKTSELQKGATWLLKRHLESGYDIAPKECRSLFKLIDSLEHWESKLHVLQCFSYLEISKSDKKTAEAFLRTCLMDANKFVRAWAYNGFYELSCRFPEYQEETKQFFEMAMRDEAPSVKARIRQLMKKGF